MLDDRSFEFNKQFCRIYVQDLVALRVTRIFAPFDQTKNDSTILSISIDEYFPPFLYSFIEKNAFIKRVQT